VYEVDAGDMPSPCQLDRPDSPATADPERGTVGRLASRLLANEEIGDLVRDGRLGDSLPGSEADRIENPVGKAHIAAPILLWRSVASPKGARVSRPSGRAPELDEREEYMQRLATRPLTSAIAAVKADGAGAFADRPMRKRAVNQRRRPLWRAMRKSRAMPVGGPRAATPRLRANPGRLRVAPEFAHRESYSVWPQAPD
jgi:hypothetical protein